MSALSVGPRIAVEADAPRRRRARVMLAALAVSLLVHAAVAAVLLWPAGGSRDTAGEGAPLVVEIVGAASQPASVEAPLPQAEPEPAVEPAVESATQSEPFAALAAIEPTAGPPPESELAPSVPAEPEPEVSMAATVAPDVPVPTAKPAPAAALAGPSADSVAAQPVVETSMPSVAPSASFGPARSTGSPVPAAITQGGSSVRVASAEPGAAPAGPAPGLDRAPLFDLPGLDNPWPDYPRLARRRGQEGEALLAVTVLASGMPAAVELRTSSGYSLLDEAALDAVRQWRFLPALVAGQPVRAVVDVPIVFRLE